MPKEELESSHMMAATETLLEVCPKCHKHLVATEIGIYPGERRSVTCPCGYSHYIERGI